VNIFYLDHDVVKCAEMHNDKHTVKMILEYCQLLSTAHRYLDGLEVIGKTKTGRNAKRWILNDERNDILYSATHIHHPSAVWCRKNAANYEWLHKLLVALCKEYTYRYGKIHKCQSTGLVDALGQLPNSIAKEQFTQPTPAMPDEVKIVGDSLASYRNYYNLNKTHLASWKGKTNSRNKPEWYIANI
jgi:hypothetical protein